MSSEKRNQFAYASDLEPREMLVAVGSTQEFLNALNGDANKITASRDLKFDSSVVIDRSVFINGANRDTKLTHNQVKTDTPLFDVRAPNVTFRDVTLEGNGRTDTNQGLVNLNNDRGFNPTGFTAERVSFLNADKGVSSNGNVPRDTTVRSSKFNTERGVEFLRDGLRGDAKQAGNGGNLNLSGNTFEGNPRFGISIDAGNDGRNPNAAPGFPNNGPRRAPFTDLPVKFKNGEIGRNNVVDAQEFGIAVSAGSNLDIIGNNVSTAQNPSGFGAGINLEHNSENVSISNNNIRTKAAEGDRFGVTVLPFQDHGASANFAQRTKNVTVDGNNFTGEGEAGIFALGTQNLKVTNNDFSKFDANSGASISSGNVPGGNNSITASGNKPSNRVNTFTNTQNADPTPGGENVNDFS